MLKALQDNEVSELCNKALINTGTLPGSNIKKCPYIFHNMITLIKRKG